MKPAICLSLLLLGLDAAVGWAQDKLDLHVVQTPIKSHRLLAMSMDDDGCIWTGSIHNVIHCYDPQTGTVEDIALPGQAAAASCLCLGQKVYILGQAYPRLIVYDRGQKEFRELAYPSARPNVWYGDADVDGRHLFLFDRGSAGVIQWDSHSDTGRVIPWPYEGRPFPSSGRYYAADDAVWCNVWDTGYVPLGIARLELTTSEFTYFAPFPTADDGLAPYSDPQATIFLPYTLKGKVVPFDFKTKRWCRFLDVPEFGQRFGFIGGPTPHNGRLYFSLSTYNGTDIGCDGEPYHFCNGLLELDPATGRFAFPTLEVKDAYYQIAYTLSAKGEFFATGTNIQESPGKLNRDRQGEVVFWQTRKPAALEK